jgi:signal peptidase
MMNRYIPNQHRTLEVVGIAILIAVLVPFVVFAVPQIVGAEHGYVVISSSMSPTMHAGDAVIVNEVPAPAVEEGDIITFMDGKQAAIAHGQAGSNLITHRVIAIQHTKQGLAFKTKGDANEEADRGLVPASRLVGRVMFTIPYIGHVIAFASTRLGFIALVAVPLGLLVLGEVYDLARAVQNEREADGTREAEPEEG